MPMSCSTKGRPCHSVNPSNERCEDSVADDTFQQGQHPLSAEVPVFHLSAAAYIAIAWFLVIVVGMGRALLKA
jgi:hypothetical protein